jgi:hypothetical protein
MRAGVLCIEARTHGSLEGGERVLVHHLDRLLLEGGREPVGIVRHPIEQQLRGLLRVGPGRLSSLDPAAVEIHDERPEVAARVVQLLGLLVAAGEKGLIEAHGPPGAGRDEPSQLTGDRLEARDKFPARSPADELPWLECGLKGGLQRILSPWLRSRPSCSCRHFGCLLVNVPSIVRETEVRLPAVDQRDRENRSSGAPQLSHCSASP